MNGKDEKAKIVFLPPAEKYLKKIKNKALKDKFEKAIVQISVDPECGEKKKAGLID